MGNEVKINSEEEMRELEREIEEARAQGINGTSVLKKKGIGQSAYYYNRKRFGISAKGRRGKKKTSFIEFVPADGAKIEVEIGGVAIKIAPRDLKLLMRA